MEDPEALGMCQKKITSVGARGVVMFCRFLRGYPWSEGRYRLKVDEERDAAFLSWA